MSDLAELERLLEAASPGPWEADREGRIMAPTEVKVDGRGLPPQAIGVVGGDDNARLAALAPSLATAAVTLAGGLREAGLVIETLTGSSTHPGTKALADWDLLLAELREAQ